MPAANVKSAIQAGFTFARNSHGTKSVLVRTAVFSVAASALWAMLPLIAKCYGSVGFGMMVASFGLGALMGAGLLPYLRRSISVDAMIGGATLLYATVTVATGLIHVFRSHCVVMFFGGAAWIVILASLNVSAQICAPSYLRARMLSMYLLVLQGGLAAGASLWGAVAERFGMSQALSVAGLALVIGLLASRRYRLGADDLRFREAPVES
jgi:hypothetical protein